MYDELRKQLHLLGLSELLIENIITYITNHPESYRGGRHEQT